MTVDVVCADPVFLDFTFEGLTYWPPPGSEYFSRELHESPGGAATTAIGLARLGLRVAVTAPLGRDLAGQALRALLEAEGIACVGPESARTPVTVVLPSNGERAMVSFAPAARVEPSAVERLRPRAVVVNAERLALAPAEAAAYAVVGDPDADRLAGALPHNVCRARALIANRSEAERLTGEHEPELAARALAEHVATAVVSCGSDGAVAASAGEVFHASAPQVDVVDTTGAGDLLAAAYVWADLAGLPLQARLRHAVVYASLSVRVPTGSAGAVSLDELERAVVDAS